ncbi:BTAD domain-containing putative transcriptional regulator [Sphaerisporangium sp. TRM90804]|uniref:BTAD domain-containing putative transcriptional regulator n=1 Tax=Sphaerisporangium sp. TRM90804 TaxID=3031113 RepID=UPI00244848E4|nr:BTAD domain-containing putative transcriptional regulator [Sphaerisporangium sp. TRM90804]MDH2428413.1 BTAD domain-containing putative transcriptional regulator [Sphaerisporangium sp. TRM90804]
MGHLVADERRSPGMQFRILGPLEVVRDGRQVSLGGARQRATLGLLLLHANRVVATSELLKALWSVRESTPPTARKIVQNAVRGLRAVFADHDGDTGSSVLLTRSPGYVLRVEPDQVDLFQFTRRAEAGRAELAAGSFEKAAVTLRDALGLWRGSVLADLVESGVTWPELTAVQNARLDVVEDYFAAELANGRHQAVLGELEMMFEAQPLRERLCYLLILALYRSGRQVDALGVYARARSTLVERLGLEPGRSLQTLQHSILVHDPALVSPDLPGRAVVSAAATAPGQAQGDRDAPPPETAATAERTNLSVIMVRTRFGEEGEGADPEGIDDTLDSIEATIRSEADRFGGTVVASVGAESLVVFGASGWHDEDAAQAVRTAVAIRDRLDRSARPAGGRAPAIHLAAATGQARVMRRAVADDAPAVRGALLVQCQALLSQASPGEILVCPTTRRSSRVEIDYERTPARGWRVLSTRDDRAGWPVAPVVERELKVLDGLLDYVRHRARPHLVTVLGAPGLEMTHFMAGFEHRVACYQDEVRFVRVQGPRFSGDSSRELQGEVLAACCEIAATDAEGTARRKFAVTIRRLAGSGVGVDADWLISKLSPLIGEYCDRRSLGGRPPSGSRLPLEGEALAAWRRFLQRTALERPLVLAINDLHRADNGLLDFVEDLTEYAGAVPLFVVATAWPELLDRRPEWGGGKHHATTMSLDSLHEFKEELHP